MLTISPLPAAGMRSGSAGWRARKISSVSREASSQPPTTAAGRTAVQARPSGPVTSIRCKKPSFTGMRSSTRQRVTKVIAHLVMARVQLIELLSWAAEPLTSRRTRPSLMMTLTLSFIGSSEKPSSSR